VDSDTTTGSVMPTTGGPIPKIVANAANLSNYCAVVGGGSVQCRGVNYFGQLGNGSAVDSSVPVTVTGVTNAVAVSAGGFHTCAVLSGGSVLGVKPLWRTWQWLHD